MIWKRALQQLVLSIAIVIDILCAAGVNAQSIQQSAQKLLTKSSTTAAPASATQTPVDSAVVAPLSLPLTATAAAPKDPITLSAAVHFASLNYPGILKAQAQTGAARENVTVQKLTEYMPDSLLQFQEVMATHNQLTQIIYGSPVFPANPGPGYNTVGMQPAFYSGLGFNLDWAPVDFGLHKARINLAKQQFNQVRAQQTVTVLDVQLAAANAYFDMMEATQQVIAAQQNVQSFQDFETVVQAQVNSQLKPGADLSLAKAELANAQNQLYRANLNLDIARINLANAIGCGTFDITIDDRGLIRLGQHTNIQAAPPVFSAVPILQATEATLLTAVAQRKVLDKEYFPVLHLLGGVQQRGSAMNHLAHLTWADGAGLIPTVPNYQVALIVNWNFLDWFRLKAEKKVQNMRVEAQRQEYNLVLMNLKAEDARSRSRLQVAIDIAQNMPVQVDAAEQASRQAQARYKAGLSSVAQVAEANQVLAQSRMQEAVAEVGVWRAMLSVAAAHGDIGPFMAESERMQRAM